VTEQSWGFPAFAKDFPRHPTLDALVSAYERGDYAAVRDGASKLAAAEDEDTAVRDAARLLRQRIEPDPSSKALFLITAAILVVLTAWWVTHSGPEGGPHRHGVTSPAGR
jgi:hypothetical protein